MPHAPPPSLSQALASPPPALRTFSSEGGGGGGGSESPHARAPAHPFTHPPPPSLHPLPPSYMPLDLLAAGLVANNPGMAYANMEDKVGGRAWGACARDRDRAWRPRDPTPALIPPLLQGFMLSTMSKGQHRMGEQGRERVGVGREERGGGARGGGGGVLGRPPAPPRSRSLNR